MQDAYEFLANNYDAQEEDEIFLFGFSRGAFAARSLSAFTGLFGIIPKQEMHAFPLAWDYYQSNADPERRDDAETNLALRYLATVGEELSRQHEDECARPVSEQVHPNEESVGASVLNDVADRAALPQYRRLPLHFVGVWDTVAEASGEGPHTHALAWNVKEAFQALATHEVRTRFTPVLWGSRCRHQIVEQTWLPGAHSDVGGGNNNPALNSIGFKWIVNRAAERGLEIDQNYCRLAGLDSPDPNAAVTYPRHGIDVTKWPFRGWRSSAARQVRATDTESRHISFDARINGHFAHDEKSLAQAERAIRSLPLAWSTAGDELVAAVRMIESAGNLASEASERRRPKEERDQERADASGLLRAAGSCIRAAELALQVALDSRRNRPGIDEQMLVVEHDRVAQRIEVVRARADKVRRTYSL